MTSYSLIWRWLESRLLRPVPLVFNSKEFVFGITVDRSRTYSNLFVSSGFTMVTLMAFHTEPVLLSRSLMKVLLDYVFYYNYIQHTRPIVSCLSGQWVGVIRAMTEI